MNYPLDPIKHKFDKLKESYSISYKLTKSFGILNPIKERDHSLNEKNIDKSQI